MIHLPAQPARAGYADRVLRNRVFSLFAKLYGESLESAPRVVQEIVIEHGELEEGADFAEIRGTVDELLHAAELPKDREAWPFHLHAAAQLLEVWTGGERPATLLLAESRGAAEVLHRIADQLAFPVAEGEERS